MTFKTPEQLMEQNLICSMYAGSIAYGTNLPTSDIDIRGVFCGDPINIRTPFFPIKEKAESAEDTKHFELAHFMKLALDCNPNIIELLWTDEVDVIHRTPAYDHLIQYRGDFLSKKIAHTTTGYAFAQLKRIKGHNKWINNPMPVEPPHQSDYVSLLHNFTPEQMFKFDIERFNVDHRLIPYGNHVYGVYPMIGYSLFNENFALNTNFEGQTHELGYPLFLVKFNYGEYQEAKEKHSQYWTWKNNRNTSRSELEEQFGYDTKHAMHLVRLLKMGKESLTTGNVIVKRPDAHELLAIRHGAWTYDEVVEYATMMDADIKELYKTSPLRHSPDLKLAAKALMEVQDVLWSTK